MKPCCFDAETSREITGDYFARLVEEKARKDADIKLYDPPSLVDELDTSYWRSVTLTMRKVIYDEQYRKRIERNNRKSSNV